MKLAQKNLHSDSDQGGIREKFAKVNCLICLNFVEVGLNGCKFVMLTRLKLQRGEGKLLVASLEVRTRRGRATRPKSPPKFSLPVALEVPQVLSLAEIEEVQVALEAEIESVAIISSVGEIEGISEEEAFKKAFYDLTKMVMVLYEERNTKMVGGNSKPPHGEVTSIDKKDEEKDSKGVEESLLHLHHLHHHPHHHHQHHLLLPQKKTPILTQKPQKQKLPYSSWTLSLNFPHTIEKLMLRD